MRLPPETTPVILSTCVPRDVPPESTRSIVNVIAVSVGRPVTVAGVSVSPVPVPIPDERVVAKRLLYFFRRSVFAAAMLVPSS